MGNTIPAIELGISGSSTRTLWANHKKTVLVEFIKNENDFRGLVEFLEEAFGFKFEKEESLYRECVIFKRVK